MAPTGWRYVRDDGVGAADGLAGDEALLLPYRRDAGAGGPAATLRLYTYRPDCALVGRYQSLEDEIDVAYCAQHGIDIGRRPTGGGAIIMGPGQLGVAIAAPAPVDRAPRQVLRRYAEGVIAGLAGLGVDAGFRSKNDLEVDGRKVAGLGLYLDPGGALLFHASVLVDLDVERMLAVLKIPGAKISDKAVARVEERITTVSRQVSAPLLAAQVRDRFAASLAAAFSVELVESHFSAEEAARRDELVASRYSQADWLFQSSARRDMSGAALLKTPEGLLRIHVGLHGDSIKSLLIAGDFNVLPGGVSRLEGALKWTRAERSAIAGVAAQSLIKSDLGVEPEAVAGAIWKATLNAQRRQRTSHPRRLDGSCYFPDPRSRARQPESEDLSKETVA